MLLETNTSVVDRSSALASELYSLAVYLMLPFLGMVQSIRSGPDWLSMLHAEDKVHVIQIASAGAT